MADECVNGPKQKQMANHEVTSWTASTKNAGTGVVFAGTNPMSVSALPDSAMDLTLASHPHKLPKAGNTYLHLDAGVTGLGGNSCGQGGPLVEDRILAENHNMGFIIRPASANLAETAHVVPAGDMPLAIARPRAWVVEVTLENPNADITHTIGNGNAPK